MSEEMIEEVTEELSDKEMNFRKLEARAEAAEARLAELQPLAVEKLIRNAGFDPDAPGAGKALLRLVQADADVDAVKSLAEELGFEPPKPGASRTPEQRVIEEQSNIQQRLQSVTTSDEPANTASQIADLDLQIQQARAQGIPTQKLVSQRIRLSTQAAVDAGPRV
jgi:hypothetical protein